MLVLRRKDGQWIHIIHQKSGESLRFRVYGLTGERNAQLAFEDVPLNFRIMRAEVFGLDGAEVATPAAANAERR